MAWNVVTRESIALDQYIVSAFGRFNLAEPFVRDFLASEQKVSDLLTLDVSAVGQLRRAIAKVAGIQNPKEPKVGKDGQKIKTKKGKNVLWRKPVNSEQVRQACDSLGIVLEQLARQDADGKMQREYVHLRKTN